MKFIKLFLILAVTLIVACSETDVNVDRFSDTYMEILIAREKYQDSLRANKEVKKIMEEHGYTEPEFRRDYFTLAKNNRKLFIEITDSLHREIEKMEIKADSIEKSKRLKEKGKEANK